MNNKIFLEFTRKGKFVKVVAIDANTAIEASIVGAVSASKAQLEKIAIAKLQYVMKKKINGQ